MSPSQYVYRHDDKEVLGLHVAFTDTSSFKINTEPMIGAIGPFHDRMCMDLGSRVGNWLSPYLYGGEQRGGGWSKTYLKLEFHLIRNMPV